MQRRFFEDFWGDCCNESIIVRETVSNLGLEDVSIVHYTWPGSSIKRPTPNQLATQCHVNWPVVYPESSYKIMDPVSAALPQILWRIFVATLLWITYFTFFCLQTHSHIAKLCSILLSLWWNQFNWILFKITQNSTRNNLPCLLKYFMNFNILMNSIY